MKLNSAILWLLLSSLRAWPDFAVENAHAFVVSVFPTTLKYPGVVVANCQSSCDGVADPRSAHDWMDGCAGLSASMQRVESRSAHSQYQPVGSTVAGDSSTAWPNAVGAALADQVPIWMLAATLPATVLPPFAAMPRAVIEVRVHTVTLAPAASVVVKVTPLARVPLLDDVNDPPVEQVAAIPTWTATAERSAVGPDVAATMTDTVPAREPVLVSDTEPTASVAVGA